MTVERTIDAIRAGDISGAASYDALPDGARNDVLRSLGGEAELLTRLVGERRRKFFAEGKTRFHAMAKSCIRTPVYLVDESLIEANMRVLRYVKDRTGCRILHALKAYASFATFGVMAPYLDGVCASGVNEARLGREEFNKEVHTFSAAFKKSEIRDVLKYSDCVIFNSFHQLDAFGPEARKCGRSIGLRVHPGHSEIATPMYDPCAPCSRLGTTHGEFARSFALNSPRIDGLHFHALCEQGSDVLERVLGSFERLYGPYIQSLDWVNFGGGHHITKDDYDIERLIGLINNFKNKYGVQVYLEPGEASVYHAGVLISSVVDIVKNDMETAILDTSAEAHMPDVLLMPYRPCVFGSENPFVKDRTYRFAGPSCLAGDVIGDYSFDTPLKRGDRVIFADMALYSIVKNTTFNGIGLPDIAVVQRDGTVKTVRRFGYRDYRNRQS